MNRFKILFTLWVVLLAWCDFFSASPHMNIIIIAFAFIGSLVWFDHIENTMNDSELKTFNILRNIF